MIDDVVVNLTAEIERQRSLFTRVDAERATVAKALHESDLHHLDHHKRDDERDARMNELSISNRQLEDERAHLVSQLRRISRLRVDGRMTAATAMERLRVVVAEARKALLVRP